MLSSLARFCLILIKFTALSLTKLFTVAPVSFLHLSIALTVTSDRYSALWKCPEVSTVSTRNVVPKESTTDEQTYPSLCTFDHTYKHIDTVFPVSNSALCFLTFINWIQNITAKAFACWRHVTGSEYTAQLYELCVLDITKWCVSGKKIPS